MRFVVLCACLFCSLISYSQTFDIVIRNGIIYDGSGNKSYAADLAINADTIAFIGDLSKAKGKTEIDAKGLAIAPGFINMLSWSPVSLIEDGRSMGDLKQGVTLEVFGEGERQERQLPPDGFRPSRVQELRSARDHHSGDVPQGARKTG